LNCCYFFFFFHSCIATIIRTITTITSNNISEGEGTPETSYKLWSSKLRNFRRRKKWVVPKLVLLLALGLGSTHTHTHTRFDYNTRSAPGVATPHTFAFIVHGFWG
jgi:hypothetical protein